MVQYSSRYREDGRENVGMSLCWEGGGFGEPCGIAFIALNKRLYNFFPTPTDLITLPLSFPLLI